MTAVTFPHRPPRLAFAFCRQRWQNDECKNNVYIESLSLHTTPLYIRYFLERFFSLEINLQDIFFLNLPIPLLKSQISLHLKRVQRWRV